MSTDTSPPFRGVSLSCGHFRYMRESDLVPNKAGDWPLPVRCFHRCGVRRVVSKRYQIGLSGERTAAA